MGKCGPKNKIPGEFSGKASGEPIPLCLEISNLPRDASKLHRKDSQTLTASRHRHRNCRNNAQSRRLMGYALTSRHRRLSGSRYSHSLPLAGYASTSRHRRLSDSRYSHSLPPAGYASTSRHRRLSDSRCLRSLPRVYVDSNPQIRHCLLAISPSRYGYSAMRTKWPTRSSSGCWSCYGQANERKQEDCGLAMHIGMMDCSNVEVFQVSRFEEYWSIRVFGA